MKIPCCICSQLIIPNEINICLKCLNKKVEIESDIVKNFNIFRCRTCNRWLKDQKWWKADWGSAQLLGICLKKIQNLKKIKIIDASFIWTEPHSKKIKIQCVVQKEVLTKVILEKKVICQFSIENKQCNDCAVSYTEHTWQSVVQVRQKVKHKKTFIRLEQLMIKYNIAHKCVGIKYQLNGLDFFFGNHSSAYHFVSFFRQTVPIKVKESKRLISHDPKSNRYHYKHTFFVEICPICRYDLVILPPNLIKSFGGWFQCLLCENITKYIHLLNVNTLELILMDANIYFKKSFNSIAVYSQTIHFFVMNNTPIRNKKGQQIISGKYALCNLELILEDDLIEGLIENTLDCRCHLANLIKEGDTVAGYHIKSINIIQDKYLFKERIPDVIIVKKVYKSRRRKKLNLKQAKEYLYTIKQNPKQLFQKTEDIGFQRDLFLYKNDIPNENVLDLKIKNSLDEIIRTITLDNTVDNKVKFPYIQKY